MQMPFCAADQTHLRGKTASKKKIRKPETRSNFLRDHASHMTAMSAYRSMYAHSYSIVRLLRFLCTVSAMLLRYVCDTHTYTFTYLLPRMLAYSLIHSLMYITRPSSQKILKLCKSSPRWHRIAELLAQSALTRSLS